MELVRADYPLTYQSGERIIGPPLILAKICRNRPQTSCEIYVWRLPPFCFEDLVFETFARCGIIYQIRIPLNRVGTTQGIAFVTFADPKSAKEAVRFFHQKSLFPNWSTIGVSFSLGPQLLICGIPPNANEGTLCIYLESKLKGVENVLLPKKSGKEHENRGHIFVRFDNHSNASEARRKFYDGTIVLWDSTALVEWAVPEILQ